MAQPTPKSRRFREGRPLAGSQYAVKKLHGYICPYCGSTDCETSIYYKEDGWCCKCGIYFLKDEARPCLFAGSLFKAEKPEKPEPVEKAEKKPRWTKKQKRDLAAKVVVGASSAAVVGCAILGGVLLIHKIIVGN